MRQPVLIETETVTVAAAIGASPPADASFRCGDRSKLYVGNKPLATYLRESGQGRVLRLAEQLDRVDVTPLLRSYSSRGRHAIHPRILLGLILLGILSGRSSLRELEQLAFCDVRAWWICGGEQPDHSTIGKFIVAHRVWISDAGFHAALQAAIHGLGLKPGDAAIDGTVIESAASHLRMLKQEAARAEAAEAKHAASNEPDNVGAQQEATRAQYVADTIDARVASRESKGKAAKQLKIASSDPDAVNQPRKDDIVRPGFKPSVLVNGDQLVLGQHVHASNEVAAVAPLLEQHERALGAPPTTLLADAGYFALTVLVLVVAKEIDLLCPAGRPSGDYERVTKRFGKRLFVYQAASNCYRCPAGHSLVPTTTEVDRDKRIRINYRCTSCRECPLRSQCTTAASRTIKRYEGDELKEAMREVMQQPAARTKYRRRGAIVEPVFARLQHMGLRRFRRRGIGRVRAEFALYCMAYNFRRADGLREAGIAAFALMRVHEVLVMVVVWARPHTRTDAQ